MAELNTKRAAAVAIAAAKGEKLPPRPPRPHYEPKVKTLKEIMTRSAARALGKKREILLTTGHWQIDRITGGPAPNDVWCIGADTSVGKSTEAVAIADENLLTGKRVLIVTGEDHWHRYGARLMCRRARCNAYRYRDRCLTPAEKKRVQTVVDQALPIPVYLDGRGVDVEELAAQILWLVAEHGIHLVEADYLTAFASKKRRFETRKAEVYFCARTMTDCMRRSGAAGILFSQLTIENRRTKPDIHHVRDCKDVGHMVETAGFLYELPKGIVKDGQHLARVGDKAMHLDKVKDGERGKVVLLKWDKKTASFRRVTENETEGPGSYGELDGDESLAEDGSNEAIPDDFTSEEGAEDQRTTQRELYP